MLRGRDAVGEGDQVIQPADVFEVPAGFEGFLDGQDVEIAVGLEELDEGFPDPAVAVEVEILSVDQGGSVHIGIRRDEHGADESLLHVAVKKLICVGAGLCTGKFRLIAHYAASLIDWESHPMGCRVDLCLYYPY